LFNLNFETNVKPAIFDQIDLWDLLIIGGGPAGLNAGLYAKRKGLTVGIVAYDIGGQLHNTTEVDNYLGFKLIQGKALSEQFHDHLKTLDVPVYSDVYVEKIVQNTSTFNVHLSSGKTLSSKTLLVTTGGAPRRLDIPGEQQFANRGVSYCTTCDAPFFKNKHVIVAGGGNSAAEAVLDLASWASHITVIHRSQWRADDILLKKIYALSNVTIHLETQLLEVLGDHKMQAVKVLDKKTNQTRSIEADGLFVEIGNIPKSELVHNLVATNERQEIIVDREQMTSVKGLFAAGDVTDQPYKQIIISAAEGAKAVLAITNYLNHMKEK
jgi:NADH-dependent peroxiredoxin subunit F